MDARGKVRLERVAMSNATGECDFSPRQVYCQTKKRNITSARDRTNSSFVRGNPSRWVILLW
jgi:hypothetical protein